MTLLPEALGVRTPEADAPSEEKVTLLVCVKLKPCEDKVQELAVAVRPCWYSLAHVMWLGSVIVPSGLPLTITEGMGPQLPETSL
jgi:hypothetical protein